MEYVVFNRTTGTTYGPLDEAKAAEVRDRLLDLGNPVSVAMYEGHVIDWPRPLEQ